MLLLGIDVTTQFAALLVQGLAALLLALIAWLVRQAWKGVMGIHKRLDHLDECTDSLRTEVTAATASLKSEADQRVKDQERFQAELLATKEKFAGEMADYREEIGWLKATVGMPLGQLTREMPATNGEAKTNG